MASRTASPVLDDRSADLVPQLQAFAAFEGAGAGGKRAEYPDGR